MVASRLYLGGWRRAIETQGGTVDAISRREVVLSGGVPALEFLAETTTERKSRVRMLIARLGESLVVINAETGRRDADGYQAEFDLVFGSLAALPP